MAVNWIPEGDAAAQLAEGNKQAIEAKKAEMGKAFDYWIKQGGEGKVLFADGSINPKFGYMTPPALYAHKVQVAGKWITLFCAQSTLPQSGDKCPLCATGDRPNFWRLFTVVDLVPYTSKKNKVIPFSRKLYPATDTTFEMLNTLAAKRGGLAGCTFDTYRKGEKAPRVGDVYDFQEKVDVKDPAIRAKYTYKTKYKDMKTKQEVEKVVCALDPLVYGDEIPYKSGDDLRKMGFGAGASSIPQGQPSVPPEEQTPEDYAEHLG